MMSGSLVILTAVALFAGVVGGIVSDVYILPEQVSGTNANIFSSRVPSHTLADTNDPIFFRDQLRRTITLVPKKEYERTGYIPLDHTYTGVVLTDTGWFVVPSFEGALLPKEWVAITAAGQSYPIHTFVSDPTYHFIYGALDGDGFRVASFATLSALVPGTFLWAMSDGEFGRTTLASPTSFSQKDIPAYVGQEMYTFKTQQPSAPGTVLWTEDGTFFGFANDIGVIVPWFVIESTYTNVFTSTSIEHHVLPVKGHVIRLTEKQSVQAEGAAYALYVDTVDTSFGNEDIVSGDVITHIADRAIEPWTLQGIVAKQGGDTVRVRVLRDGTRQDLSLPKVLL